MAAVLAAAIFGIWMIGDPHVNGGGDSGVCLGATAAVRPADAPAASALQRDVYDAAFPLATALYRHVNQLRSDVANAGLPELLPEANRAVASAESVKDGILDRLPTMDLQYRVQLCDDVWQPFAARASRALSGSAARVGVDKADADLSSLRRVLQGKGPVAYPLLPSVTLARQLHETAARLVDMLGTAPPSAVDLRVLHSRARWVLRQADALDRTIGDGADLPAVVDQLQRFDGVWNSFFRLADSEGRLDGNIRGAMAQVVEDEHRLQQELDVPPSTSFAAAPLNRELAGVAADAGDLMLSLESELPNAPEGVLDAARDFYLQSENCMLRLLNHPDIRVYSPDFTAMTDSWGRLTNQLHRIERAQAPASLEQADRLETEIREIRSRLLQIPVGSPTEQFATPPSPGIAESVRRPSS